MTSGTSSPTADSADERMASIGKSRGWQIGLGVAALAAGLAMLVWPDVTLLAVAVIFGVQLILAGVFRLVTAFFTDGASGAVRALFVLLGALLIIVGILCLRAPFQTVTILLLLAGLSWILNGVIELFHGFTGGGGWSILAGAISLGIGIVVLVYPAPSAITMVWVLGISLVVIGAMELLRAAMSGGRRSPAAAGFPGRARPATP
ncbi:MAG: HdeD family acid-resistance protein [Labedaea sp.]